MSRYWSTFWKIFAKVLLRVTVLIAHYYTLPIAWNVMLKIYARKVWVVHRHQYGSIHQYCDIRSGNQFLDRYAQVSNMRSYIGTSSYLMNYDVNNLYRWAMCQPLSYAEFRTSNFNASAIALDLLTSYILEVNLEYLQRISHKQHIDLPFCPIRRPTSTKINF